MFVRCPAKAAGKGSRTVKLLGQRQRIQLLRRSFDRKDDPNNPIKPFRWNIAKREQIGAAAGANLTCVLVMSHTYRNRSVFTAAAP
jgi:hypothetical protein